MSDGGARQGYVRCEGELQVEGVALTSLAQRFGTPLYVYSRTMIEAAYERFAEAFAGRDHLVCYAVKANSNLGVLDVLVRRGAGFDIVSEGELRRVLAAGADPSRVVFSGVGKRRGEMLAALQAGIRCFNVESLPELERLSNLAEELGVLAPVSLRINPDVDAQTHPYISTGLRENKFGIDHGEALQAYRRAASLPGLAIKGIDCHIGSQLTSTAPYRDAVRRLVELVDALAAEGIVIEHLDAGGGQGIRYRDEIPLDIADWAQVLVEEIGERALQIVVEPGRYIVGPAGVLLTRVEYLKRNAERRFAVVDAAMNDLLRPALYGAWQAIEPVSASSAPEQVYDIVGPVCESADFLGKQRTLAIEEGDLLAVRDSGAYVSVMASNYNTRPRAAEVLVDGEQAHLVRAREEIVALFDHEYTLP